MHCDHDPFRPDGALVHFLAVIAGGRQRMIPVAALDVKATISANHDRGIEIRIPTHENEAYVTF